MAELKTKVTESSVPAFIKKIPDETKRKDSVALLSIFKEVTGEKPKLWGGSIIGFGSYHYKSERSAQEGDWPLVGFSPRKQNLTLYLMLGMDENLELLKKLGKHKRSVGCLYLSKLSDVDETILKQLIKRSFSAMKRWYGP